MVSSKPDLQFPAQGCCCVQNELPEAPSCRCSWLPMFCKLIDYSCWKMIHTALTNGIFIIHCNLTLWAYSALETKSIQIGWLGQRTHETQPQWTLAKGTLELVVQTFLPVSICWMELILHFVLQPQTVFLTTENTVFAIGLFAFQEKQAKQFL